MTQNRRMGLLGKIFTNKGGAAPAPQGAAQPAAFADSDLGEDDGEGARLQQRRDVIQRVLRDTMSQHGIPSDWIDCRILTGDAPGRSKGLHVQLVVRHGQDRLLTYVFAFQESFRSEFARVEPRAEWLHSLAWEFADTGALARAVMPPAGALAAGLAAAAPVTTAPVPLGAPQEHEERLAHAPLGGARPAAAAQAATAEEDDLAEDLQALYAIRDAALKQTRGSDTPDFEPTRPGDSF
jgi:hypothetical protein